MSLTDAASRYCISEVTMPFTQSPCECDSNLTSGYPSWDEKQGCLVGAAGWTHFVNFCEQAWVLHSLGQVT